LVGRRVATLLSIAIVVNQAAALLCQFVQHTDPRFPLLYFTVDSGAFAGAVALIAVVRPRLSSLPGLRAASAVGVLLSAVIFASVIAPATGTGTWIQPYDDYWVRTATILFHAVAPVLVTIDFVIHGVPRRRTRRIIYWCLVWPLAYIIVMGGLAVLGLVGMPYPFLDPSNTGWGTVLGSVGSLSALILLLTSVLLALSTGIRALTPSQRN
jgi:hypothetical protein